MPVGPARQKASSVTSLLCAAPGGKTASDDCRKGPGG